jgi:hypothetical protein
MISESQKSKKYNFPFVFPFSEAVALARLRLFRKDPKLMSVYTAWAEHYVELGCLEQAAKW